LRTLLVAAVCAAALAACGGGGGGGGSVTPAGPATPTPTPTAAPIQAAGVQRADAAQALTSYNGTQQIAIYGGGAGGSSIASLRRAIDASAARVTSGYRRGFRTVLGAGTRAVASVTYSACSSGVESATNIVSPTEEQVYTRLFYDAACTKLYQDTFLDVVATSVASASATGTATVYDTSGTAYDYKTIALTIGGIGSGTGGTISVIADDAPNATAPKSATIGVACSLASTSLACGIGAVARESAISQDLGATVGIAATATTASTGAVTVPVSGSAASYTGALGSLTLAQATFPNFIVSGGTTADSGTFQGTFTYTSTGVLVSGSFKLSDASADGTVTVTSVGTPATGVNGVITRTSTGQTVATFSVDINGNGTIAYSNGTTGRIVNWQIFG
jgi:hypothetical protein